MGTIDWKAKREDAKAATVLIPDGEYLFECVSAEAKLSNGGAPQIVADFLCKDDKYSKRTVRNWFTLTEDNALALDIWFRTMAVFGMDDAYWDKDPEMEDIAEKIMGSTVVCSIVSSDYNGRTNNKISFFKKAGAAAARKTTGSKGAPAPAPRKAAPSPRPAANAAEGEEPPF